MYTYEIHITVPYSVELARKEYIKLAKTYGWHTSSITDDPILGSGDNFYFTTHAKQFDIARSKMSQLMFVLKARNIFIKRTKIERIVFDERFTEETKHG